MTFGDKLKKLRLDNGLTQEELSEKIFVTRTAVSKWETGGGYPSIDSLKAISNLFGVSIDELISDADMESKKALDEKSARKFYFVAIAFLALTVVFTLLAYFLKLPLLNIGSMLSVAGYIAFGLISKPKYKRIAARKLIVPYLLSRLIIFAVVLAVAIYTVISL